MSWDGSANPITEVLDYILPIEVYGKEEELAAEAHIKAAASPSKCYIPSQYFIHSIHCSLLLLLRVCCRDIVEQDLHFVWKTT